MKKQIQKVKPGAVGGGANGSGSGSDDGERHARNQSIFFVRGQSQKCDIFISRPQKKAGGTHALATSWRRT